MQFVGQLNSVPSWKFSRFSLVWAASVLRPLSNSWMQTVPALWPHRCIWKNGAALDAQIQCISRQEWMDFMMGPQGTRSIMFFFYVRRKINCLQIFRIWKFAPCIFRLCRWGGCEGLFFLHWQGQHIETSLIRQSPKRQLCLLDA